MFLKKSTVKNIAILGIFFGVFMFSSCEHFFTQIHVSNLSADTKELTSTGVLVESRRSSRAYHALRIRCSRRF